MATMKPTAEPWLWEHWRRWEIVNQEVSSKGLWNVYQYTIVNGDYLYEIEIDGFGEIGTGSGDG